jgi:hypothetical protein
MKIVTEQISRIQCRGRGRMTSIARQSRIQCRERGKSWRITSIACEYHYSMTIIISIA